MSSEIARKKTIMTKNDEASGQIYAINAPKIFLETLTARSTTLIFAITYIAFIVGFGIDINSAYKGFTSSNIVLPGSNDSPSVWNGTVQHLSNVISVSLSVQRLNISGFVSSNSSDASVIYDATIWACYLDIGCGNKFSEDSSFDKVDVWHEVLSSNARSVTLEGTNPDQLLTPRMLIPTTFQNQESIPARGKVRSYYFHIKYYDNSSSIYDSRSVLSPLLPASQYTINILTRPGSSVTSGTFSVILLFIVCVTLVSFIYVMRKQKKKWLTEQKWVCYYLAALILFINPIYCVIVWQTNVSPRVVFAFYFFDAMGQAAFFVVWLLFADNISRKALSHFTFYGPKILIGFAIFVMSVVALVYQFPSVSPPQSVNSRRNPVQAVIDWSPELLYSFTAVSIAGLLLMLIWVLYWLVTLYLTGRKLKSLPYMNTRYLQLSYRFFLLQAYLLAAYFVFQYCFVVYFLLRRTASGGVQNIVELTDYLNALTRQQTQLFGKVVFLTIYALVLTFLFLPASLVDSTLTNALASTYVLTEDEMKKVVKSRRVALSKGNHVLAGVVQSIVDTKAEVFCVETALTFCNISFEAYYDSPTLKTEAGYDTKAMDLGKYGHVLVDIIYRPDHETFCLIARHKTLNKLVVCFRGTSCKKHWSDNLNYTQRELDLPNLNLLDAVDGLGILDVVPVPHQDTSENGDSPGIEMRPRHASESAIDVEQPSSPCTPDSQAEENHSKLTRNPLSFHETPLESVRKDLFHRKPSFSLPSFHTNPESPQERWRRPSYRHHTSAVNGNDVDDGLIFEDDHEEEEEEEIITPVAETHRKFSLVMPRRLSLWKIDEDEEEGPDQTVPEGTRSNHAWRDANEFMATGASTLGRGMNHVASTVAGATSNVVGGATDLVVGVAAITPGLKKLVRPQVHSGFWEAYAVVREDLHSIVRRELKSRPAQLYFVGHSLGGALATLAALDCTIHTVPRVNAYLARVREVATRGYRDENTPTTPEVKHHSHGLIHPQKSFIEAFKWSSADTVGVTAKDSGEAPSLPATYPDSPRIAGHHHRPHSDHSALSIQHPRRKKVRAVGVRNVTVTMYNFGSPRVGNGFFALLYNRIVPDSFRTVIDGDLVTSMPPTGYRHIGTQALVDNLGAGSIIIDPSFIERRLRTHTKSSVSVHSLLVYRKGISGVRDAAEYMKDQAKHFQIDVDKFDVVRLALKAANMARNNSFARRPAKFFCRKPAKPVDLSVPEEESSEAKVMDSAPPPPDIHIPDYIPPSGGTGSPFKSMGVLSKHTAEEGALCSTSFATVSDSSPNELITPAVSWNEGQEEGDVDAEEPYDDHNGGVLTSSHKSDRSSELDKSPGELEYEEAAHYANDVVTARSLFQGRAAPNVNPLDSYFKAVLRTLENCTAPLHSNETPLPTPVVPDTIATDDDFVTAPDVENNSEP